MKNIRRTIQEEKFYSNLNLDYYKFKHGLANAPYQDVTAEDSTPPYGTVSYSSPTLEKHQRKNRFFSTVVSVKMTQDELEGQ